MWLIKLIRKLVKGLSGADSPNQIAFGIGLGLMLGLVPFGTGYGVFLFLLILALKVSFPFALVGWSVAALLRVSVLPGILVDIGYGVLWELPFHDFWRFFLNLPLVALMGLDRCSVMGGAVLGLALAAALFFPVRFFVVRYREVVVEKLSKSKAFKYFTNLWLIRILKWVLVGSGR